MRVVSCLVLVAAVSAAPIDLNFKIDVPFINTICSKLQDPSRAEFIDHWIVDPVCTAPADVKQQIADFANNFHAGKYPVPHDREAFSKLLTAEAPAAAKIYTSVYDEAIGRYKKLSPGAQAFVAKWEKKGYANLDSDRAKMFIGAMQDSHEFIKDSKDLTQADWDSLKAQFPGFVNAYNSPKAQDLILYLTQLGPNFDWTAADEETLNKVMEMSLAEFLPKN